MLLGVIKHCLLGHRRVPSLDFYLCRLSPKVLLSMEQVQEGNWGGNWPLNWR